MKDLMGKGFMANQERGWKSAIRAAFNLATMTAREKKLKNCDFLQIH